MKKPKHRKARPHWERESSRRSNGVSVIEIPDGQENWGTLGTFTTYKEVPKKTRRDT